MDGTKNNTDEPRDSIWLRYTTQFNAGGRTHTIEVGIPVPLGASAEQREQLLREADAGLNQLASHVERRVQQIQQRGNQPAQSTSPLPQQPPRPSTVTAPVNRPASVPAPQTTALASPPTTPSVREPATDRPSADKEEAPARREEPAASARPNAAASGGRGDNSAMTLPDFIQSIKENFNLTPKQAMDYLNVKTLSGVNLREALEQLKSLVGKEQDPAKATRTPQGVRESSTAPSGERQAGNATPSAPFATISATTDSGGTHNSSRPAPANGNGRSGLMNPRENHPIQIFDEEVGPDDEQNDLDGELEDDLSDPFDELEDLEATSELSPEERAFAIDKLSALREARGASTANPRRLQALNNVVSSQISDEQLNTLIMGIWNVTNVNKLKVDQLEALISWAKLDDFVSEVDAVLAMIEEERYARGNR